MTDPSSGSGTAEAAPLAPSGIDPDELAIALKVLAELDQVDQQHPDYIAVRRATGKMFRAVKRARRKEIRDAIAEADRAVVARTATGAPDRIDDETRGLDLATSVVDAPIAGELLKPRNCYICKKPYTLVDAFYHQLCPDCARFSHAKRDAHADLTGKRALLTGGRAKIGMHIALRLLRDGAHLTITTRFPRDAVRRFSSLPDSADWLHRLRVVGIDLRDPAQVIALADSVAAQGPLDILINNAAQTVRRSPGAYSLLADAELQPLPNGPLPEMETFGHTADPHPQALQASVDAHLAGTFKGANAFLGVADKVVQVTDWNPAIPAEIMTKIKETEAKIADGSFSPFTGPIAKADGSEGVAAGATMTDPDIIAMDWHVKGVTTPLPK